MKRHSRHILKLITLISIVSQTGEALDAPTGLEASTDGYESLTVTFPAVAGADEYWIYAAENESHTGSTRIGFGYPSVEDPQTIIFRRQYSEFSFERDLPYYIRARAVSGEGTPSEMISPYSDTVIGMWGGIDIDLSIGWRKSANAGAGSKSQGFRIKKRVIGLQKQTFYSRIRNSGNATDSFRALAGGGGLVGHTKTKIIQLSPPLGNVTAQFKGGRAVIYTDMKPGEQKLFKAQMRFPRKRRTQRYKNNFGYRFTMTAQSTTDYSVSDTVQAAIIFRKIR